MVIVLLFLKDYINIVPQLTNNKKILNSELTRVFFLCIKLEEMTKKENEKKEKQNKLKNTL